MYPQPHFEGEVARIEPAPVEVANDNEFGEHVEAPATLESLYAKRRAHEKHLKLSYRDPKIDQDAIMSINEEIAKQDGGEEGYQAYLKEVRESD